MLTAAEISTHEELSHLHFSVERFEPKTEQNSIRPDKIGQILVAKNIITDADLREALEQQKQKPGMYLGQILCEMGIPQSKIIKGLYFNHKRKKLGEILVGLNVITAEQLDDILIQQKYHNNKGVHKYLGTLLAMNKIISEDDYIHALSAHFSMPIVSLKGYRIYPTLQKVIGEQFALTNRIVVLNNGPQKVTVAIAEPHLLIFDYFEKAAPQGKYILFCLARSSEIEACFDEKYVPFHTIMYR